MKLFRRLGRTVERFKQLASAAAEDTADDREGIQCSACDAWIPASYDQCLQCGRRSARAVLGVSEDASRADVNEAAREKIKAAHPDQGGSIEEFERVKEARDRLLDS